MKEINWRNNQGVDRYFFSRRCDRIAEKELDKAKITRHLYPVLEEL